MASGGVHPAAHAFSTIADDYERARPGYPPEAVAWMVARMDLRAGRRVLDLAAGTGKLTRALVDTGAAVIAVEPVDGMRRILAGTVTGASVVAGVAQAIPVGRGRVEGVTVAQAFHWFASSEAVAEVHRVLAPDGVLAVVWNWRDLTDPLQAAVQELLAPVRGDAPRSTSDTWRTALVGDNGDGGPRPRFTPADRLRLEWRQPVDVDGVARRAASTSFVSAMDDRARRKLLEQIRDVARRQPPPLALAYITEVSCFRPVG